MTKERLEEVRLLQEQLRVLAHDADAPVMLVAGDDSSVELRGNENGLLRFAAELLEVSAGGAFAVGLLDWVHMGHTRLEQIVLDPSPRLIEPKQNFKSELAGLAFIAFFFGVWILGAFKALQWLEHIFAPYVWRLLHS